MCAIIIIIIIIIVIIIIIIIIIIVIIIIVIIIIIIIIVIIITYQQVCCYCNILINIFLRVCSFWPDLEEVKQKSSMVDLISTGHLQLHIA